MQMEDSQGKKLNDDEVVHNIVSLVFAGYESTSNAIMWAVYHLAKSPHALHKLRVRLHTYTIYSLTGVLVE